MDEAQVQAFMLLTVFFGFFWCCCCIFKNSFLSSLRLIVSHSLDLTGFDLSLVQETKANSELHDMGD